MKIKTLLLGTAAAFAVAGGAQAADLAVAVEPIDYVKVCDAYGAGFYYIPGTDTCLKIAGDAKLDVKIYGGDGAPEDNWSFETEGNVAFHANTMSDMGLVTTFIQIRGNMPFVGEGGDSPATKIIMKKAYGAIGPVLFGYTGSAFDTGGGSAYSGDGYRGQDNDTNQLRLSYLMGTWGLVLALEDPYYLSPATASGDYPDLVAKITGAVGGASLGASVKVSDQTYGTGWAATATLGFDLGGGASLKVGGGYSSDLGQALGGAAGTGDTWTALVDGAIALSGNTTLVATASYIDDGVVGDTGWQGAIGPHWAVTPNAEIGVEAFFNDAPGADSYYGGHVRFKTKFAGGT